jgi:hypothetical protein
MGAIPFGQQVLSRSQNMNNQDEIQDRRQSVRVPDRILLSYSPVEAKRYESFRRDFENGIPLYNHEEFEEIRLYVNSREALTRLRDRDEDLAEFLQYLDNKLNLLLRGRRQAESPLDRLASHEVSLSSGGMAFVAGRPFEKDDRLELHLVLLPSYNYICCLGSVVNSQIIDQGRGHRISLRFSLLTDEDRERLIQHIFRLQSLALRHRRTKQ